MSKQDQQIVKILLDNARVSNSEIATMLDIDVKTVESTIRRLEKDGVILQYKTIVNEQKLSTKKSKVMALIEVGIRPEKNTGFDKIGQRICKFKQVKDHYLISGRYDFLLIVEGESLEEISTFVTEKLAPLENVKSTTTYFIMKKYKENGIAFDGQNINRLIVSP